MQGVFRADLLERKAKIKAYHMRLLTILAVSVFVLVCLTSYATWRHFLLDLPKIASNEEIWTANRKPSLEMVDASGETITIRGPRYGRRVSVDALPAHVLQAFLAVEDARFFEHGGVDLWSIGRRCLRT